MATTTTEESSPVPTTVAPQQPDLEDSLKPNSEAEAELGETQCDREEKEDEEHEEVGRSCDSEQENTKGKSLDPEWVEERFRIDRKKLETMLYAPKHEVVETGEEFFERVMRETNTQVKWPSKLKIGAKSKKDPHVKVEGKRANVLEAKRKILEVLETRVNKVTLKMDVAYTEHSHVIGKGGGNIKKVMEVTSCHIHFPDSNRHNATGEKSNQVSIAGPVEGVEEARRRIRDLQPLSLTFDLPVSLVPQALPDPGSPLIQQVVQTLGVSVSFRAMFKYHVVTIYTITSQKATCILMDLLLGAEVAGGIVNSQLDVTSQQHLFLLGQNGAHFLSVMHQTQTQIILPDLSAPQSPPSLLIQGSPDGVCLARQHLMDCLPVCLMFDMREDGEADPCKLAQMMRNLGVFISVKPKVKQTSKSVVVKGLERNISCLYEARRLLLGLDSSETVKIAEMTPGSLLPGSGLTNYWLNMLLQQLRLSEQGESPVPVPATEMPNGTKPRPSPPPGLTSPTEEGRVGPKGTDGRPLEKILENEDQFGQHESSECAAMSSSETCDALKSSISRIGLNVPKSHFLTLCLCVFMLAMQRKPIVTEVRTPTDTWSGLGFSKSMPAEAVKELRNISRRNYKPYLSTGNNQQQSWAAQTGKVANGSDSENWRDRRGSTSSSQLISSSSSSSSSSPSSPLTTFSSSSSFPRSPSPHLTDDLPELLGQLGLLKYIDVFEQQEIDYQTFLTLSDEDLKEVGVSTFGARRKMLLAISGESLKRLSDTPAVKSGYLEGGASGRLPRIMDVEAAAQSNRW
uniref:Protein bicaudal C homolog 1-B-like n=1 Tax=Pundamilia nyererei TaxID=303518 RepID=A0A3B4EUX2_9CICH